eukprot:Skav204137  [mRNA]  locus=scaffold4340:64785:77175:+ [translate_table: standard]
MKTMPFALPEQVIPPLDSMSDGWYKDGAETLEYLDADPFVLFGIDDALTQQATWRRPVRWGRRLWGARLDRWWKALVKLDKFPALMCETVPTLEEWAYYLRIDPKNDPSMLWLVRAMMETELPKPWTCYKGIGSIVCYLRSDTGQVTWKHPFYDYFRQLRDFCRQASREEVMQGKLRPCVVEAGAVIVAENLTNEPPTKYELSQMSSDELMKVASAGCVDGMIEKKKPKKTDIVDVIYDNWRLLLRRIREKHEPVVETAQPEVSQPSEAVEEQPDPSETTEKDIPSDNDEESDEDEGETSSIASSELSLSDFFDFHDDEVDAHTADDYDDGNLPISYLTDASDFAPPKLISVKVKEPKGGRVLVTFNHVDCSTTTAELKQKIAEFAQQKSSSTRTLAVDDFKLVHGQKMELDTCLQNYLEDENTNGLDVEIVLVLRGGGLRRPPPKKDEAMRLVKKKIEKHYREQTEDDTVAVADDDLPQSFKTFLQESITDKVNEFMLMKSTIGQNYVATCLRTLPMDSLKVLQTIFTHKQGTKKLSNEEKAVRCLQVLFPAMATIAKCQSKLTEMENDTTVKMLHLFVDEFHNFNEQTGVLQMDGALFLSKVQREISNREDRGASVNTEAVANNCIVQ